MGEINREKIISLAGEAQKAVAQLSRYEKIPSSEIVGSSEKLGNIKYQFVVGIEACIDVCQHIASKLFAQVPESYAGCFDVLEEHGVIDKELAGQMAELARFRNLLVYLYRRVDDSRVVEMISRTKLITRYVQAVAVFCGL